MSTNNIEDGIRKAVLAGIGAVAAGAEKGQEIFKDLVEKGEAAVSQGKVINEELKHNVSEAVKEKFTVTVTPESAEDIIDFVDKMTPEQIARLKAKLAEMDNSNGEEAKDEAGE